MSAVLGQFVKLSGPPNANKPFQTLTDEFIDRGMPCRWLTRVFNDRT